MLADQSEKSAKVREDALRYLLDEDEEQYVRQMQEQTWRHKDYKQEKDGGYPKILARQKELEAEESEAKVLAYEEKCLN